MEDLDEQAHQQSPTTADTKQTSPNRVRAVILGAACGVATAILLAVIYFAWTSMPAGPRLSEVDAATLEAMRVKWKDNGPENYDIEITVSGPQEAVYRVEVRDGKAASATRNSSPLTDRRTMGTWSVPGMFDTIESDVAHAEDPIQVSAREARRVTPLARFDPQYGYPERYRRIEWGGDMEVSWVVTEFQIVQ